MIIAYAILLLAFIEQGSGLEDDDATYRSNILRGNILRHLDMKETPTFTKEEFLSFQIPEIARNEYDDLMKKRGLENNSKRHRTIRSAEPSLAGLFRSVHKNPNIPGDVIYTDTFRQELQFDMEGRIPQNSVITMAELRLFKKLPNINNRLNSLSRHLPFLKSNDHEHHRNQLWHPSPVRHARVSVFHTLKNAIGEDVSTLIDSKMIIVNGSGWQSFDITPAVVQWQRHPIKFMSIVLELRIESARPGREAADIARMIRFTSQKVNKKSPRRPELIVFTEEEKPSKNDCRTSKSGRRQKCCRDSNYIDFKSMEWTQYWIVEPKGYEAYACNGRCREGRNNRGPRSCTVAQSSPLPVMYLVKRDGIIQTEIAEFPNMIVEKCGCSLDSVFNV